MLMGVLVIVLAIVAVVVTTVAAAVGRLGPNPFAGLRFGHVRDSPAAWRAGHRAAVPLVVVGGLVAIACVGAPVVGGWSDDAAAPAILAGTGVLLVSVLAGTWRANTAARAVSEGEGRGAGRASPRA